MGIMERENMLKGYVWIKNEKKKKKKKGWTFFREKRDWMEKLMIIIERGNNQWWGNERPTDKLNNSVAGKKTVLPGKEETKFGFH